MTHDEAEALARLVAEATCSEPHVVPDGEWFAVTVAIGGGTWCLYDEAHWLRLRGQITEGT